MFTSVPTPTRFAPAGLLHKPRSPESRERAAETVASAGGGVCRCSGRGGRSGRNGRSVRQTGPLQPGGSRRGGRRGLGQHEHLVQHSQLVRGGGRSAACPGSERRRPRGRILRRRVPDCQGATRNCTDLKPCHSSRISGSSHFAKLCQIGMRSTSNSWRMGADPLKPVIFLLEVLQRWRQRSFWCEPLLFLTSHNVYYRLKAVHCYKYALYTYSILHKLYFSCTITVYNEIITLKCL